MIRIELPFHVIMHINMWRSGTTTYFFNNSLSRTDDWVNRPYEKLLKPYHPFHISTADISYTARIVFISNGWLAHSSRCCYLGWLTIRLVNRQLKLLLCIRTICQNCNGPSSPPYHSTEGGSNCLKGCDWIVITITVVIIINSSSSTAFNL